MTRRIVTSLVSWLAVVALASGMVWLVITRVGGEVRTTAEDTIRPDTASPKAGQASSSPGAPSVSSPAVSTPAVSTPSSSAASPVPVAGTWQGAAGLLRVSCVGAQVSLGSAFPATGWHYSIDARGPERVRVEFERADLDVKVEARCIGGRPEFAVRGDGGDGGGEESD